MMAGTGLEKPHVEFLEARGISVELAIKLGLHSSVQSFPTETGWEKAKAISMPIVVRGKVINHQHRRTSSKQFIMDKGAALAFFNHDVLLEKSSRPLVITEGYLDAIVAIQAGWQRVVSVPNGAPKEQSEDAANAKRYEFLWDARRELLDVERFILATDGDDAGIALRHDLVSLLGPVRCSFVEYPEGCKDLNDVLLKYGAETVTAVLNHAKPVPVEGLHRLADFPDAPPLPMFDLQIPGLTDRFGLVPATFTLITGYAGHGKSSLVMKKIANLLASGIHVTIASFETLPKPILERRLQAALVEAAEFDPTIWKGERGSKAAQILADRLTIIANTPDEEHELDLERLLDLMETAVARHGVKLIVIDPWNELEHKRLRDETETEYIGRALRMIKRFCHRTGCSVWLVAHPRKPSTDGAPKPPSLYDLAGSANFANKADYGIVVHRPNLEANDIDVTIAKVRMGLPGHVCRVTLRFQPSYSRYEEVTI